MRQTILLIDDDLGITNALGMALECEGRTVVICSDVESAELALLWLNVTHVVSDIQFSGLFGFEGLHFGDRIRSLAPAARTVFMTGYWSLALRAAAAACGAVAMLSKPFDVADLEDALGDAPRDGTPYELVRVPSIDEIIATGRIGTAFQPIVSVHQPDGEPFAFEALTRLKGGWPIGGVATLFEYAVRCGREADLNRAAIVSAIETGAALPPRSLIFINVDPPTFNDARLAGDVVTAAARAGMSLERVVLEITERTSLSGDPVCAETFRTLHKAGVRFALDDHASAYSHMATISMTRPSFFKISGTFGTGFETDRDKQRIIRNVLSLARDFGCSTVIEGIETEATAMAARKLGIELAQGYFFGRPFDASHWSPLAA